MLDMGVNAVRTSHYPHDPAFYEMADEKGLLVYCEIPYYLIYSKADSYKNSITNQLTEMIRQGYNYPSIVMWGVQNEVRYSEQFASYGPDFKVTEDELVAFNSALVDLAHQEDPNRLIVQANIDGADAVNTSAKWSSKIDLTGMNLYVGFKSPVRSADAAGHKQLVESLTTKMNNYQKVLGADSMMLSEYGAGANIRKWTVLSLGMVLWMPMAISTMRNISPTCWKRTGIIFSTAITWLQASSGTCSTSRRTAMPVARNASTPRVCCAMTM